MSSAEYSGGRRRTAYAQAAAAKARRQMIIAGVLGVGLVGVLVFEAPTFLKLFRGSKSASPVAAPTVPTTPVQAAKKKLATIRRSPAVDPFAFRVSGSDATGVRDAPIPPGSHDPFAAPAVKGSTPSVAATPLPQQIVIGTPGAGRKATHGWIVILASIPTAQGQESASKFAATARQNGISPVAVLNSSNRKPLRGGYWVVYTGPFESLGDVSSQANQVHSHGYATAYIRELVVYR